MRVIFMVAVEALEDLELEPALPLPQALLIQLLSVLVVPLAQILLGFQALTLYFLLLLPLAVGGADLILLAEPLAVLVGVVAVLMEHILVVQVILLPLHQMVVMAHPLPQVKEMLVVMAAVPMESKITVVGEVVVRLPQVVMEPVLLHQTQE